MKLHACILVMIMIGSGAQVLADSDGTVAFGNKFVVFTTFAQQMQTLNVVPLLDNAPLKVVTSVDLPISYSDIIVHDDLILLRWWKTLYAFRLTGDWKIEKLKTLDLPEPDGKSLSLAGEILVFHNRAGNLCLDLSKPPAEWVPRPMDIKVQSAASDREFNKYGDWTPRGSDCMSIGECTICLVYAVSRHEDRIFTDKFLVRRNRLGSIESSLYVATRIETISH